MIDKFIAVVAEGNLDIVRKTLARIQEAAIKLAALTSKPFKLSEYINTPGKDGRTALMVAAECGHEDIVAELIAAGADQNLKDNHGRTAFDLAAAKRKVAILTQLTKGDEKGEEKASQQPGVQTLVKPLFADKRIIINSCFNQRSSIGDATHQVTILKPKTLKTFSNKIQIATNQTEWKDEQYFQMVYLTMCEDTPQILRQVIDLYKESGLIWHHPTKEQSAVSDGDLKTYLKELLALNPHLHIITYNASLEEKISPTMYGDAYNSYLKTHPHLQEQLQHVCYAPQISLGGIPIEAGAVLNTLWGEIGAARVDNISLHSMGVHPSQHGMVMENPEMLMLAPKPPGAFDEAQEALLKKKIDFLLSIDDKVYLKLLLGDVTEEQMEPAARAFLLNNLFIPGFIQDHEKMKDFFDLADSKEADKYQNVVFHINQIPFPDLNLNLLGKKFGKLILKDFGKEPRELKIPNGTGDRALVIVRGYPLARDNYKKLYKVPQCFAAGSGDNSLQNIMGNGLVPYFAVPSWPIKRDFVADFTELSKKHSRTGLSMTPPRIVSSQTNETFFQEWQATLADVQKNYNFLDRVPGFLIEGANFGMLCECVKRSKLDEAVKILDQLNNNSKQLASFCHAALEFNEIETAAFIYYYSLCRKITDWHNNPNIMSHLKKFIKPCQQFRIREIPGLVAPQGKLFPMFLNENNCELGSSVESQEARASLLFAVSPGSVPGPEVMPVSASNGSGDVLTSSVGPVARLTAV